MEGKAYGGESLSMEGKAYGGESLSMEGKAQSIHDVNVYQNFLTERMSFRYFLVQVLQFPTLAKHKKNVCILLVGTNPSLST